MSNKLETIMKYKHPDMSHVKPPTVSAAKMMVKNLRAAAGTKADNK